MNLREAKALRDEIRETGRHCTVPLAPGSPDGYVARIVTRHADGAFGHIVEFASRDAWLAYQEEREREREQDAVRDKLRSTRRSPLDLMIDRAVGLE